MTTLTNDRAVKLAYFFREKHSLQFDWRSNNCAFFAADWIAILTGADPCEEYRKLSGRGLVKWMRENSLADVIVATCQQHGWAEVKVPFAQRGDLVQTDQEGTPALGVCNGLRSGFSGPDGLTYLPTLNCQRAWRIS